MKRYLALVIFFPLAGIATAQSGTLRQDSLGITPTWRGRDSSGGTIIMREKPLSITPTYEIKGPGGYNGTLQQNPLGITPTWRGHDNNGGDLRMQPKPLGITPTYNLQNSPNSLKDSEYNLQNSPYHF